MATCLYCTAAPADLGRYCSGWKLRDPEHKWCKTVPDRSGQLNCRYVFVEPGTRGAWPATYAWE